MAKGSQLSQLKSALNKAGITGQHTNGKKRKRAPSDEKDKVKKAAKLNDIRQKLNPFDVKVTRVKHDVGGRKLKGIIGRPAKSKQAGLQQRKKTLLKEFEEKDRAGGILDRRFGENDPTMSVEERMLERFTKERQRTSKVAAFNLDDEDELTHYGQSLSKLDDFDDVVLGAEDGEEDDRGQIDSKIVKLTHFGGFQDDDEDEDEEDDGEPARKKTKAEVMAEVMAKSKEHKLRRQMEKEHEDNIRHELDQEFDSLRDLLYAANPSSTGSNSIPLGEDKTARADKSTPLPATLGANDADYDQRVRELAFDKRAKPKDRTKTEEELALEEKEALEKAERRRRRRMLGEDEEDSDQEDTKSRGKRKRGADDLDDDFAEGETEWAGIGAGLGDELKSNSDGHGDVNSGREGGSDDEDGSEADDGSESEEDGGQDESENSEGEQGEQKNLVAGTSLSERRSKSSQPPSKELPYTFPCPSTHEEFLGIVDGVQDDDVPVVVKRIRTLYHTSLSPDNKFKLQALTTVLIDYILYIAAPPSPRYTLLSSVMPHLIALTRAYPIASAEHFNAKLALMHKNLKRGLSRGALDSDAKTWPGLSELTLLRVIGDIWSTSDLNHAVITPARLLIGAYLGLGRIRSIGDIASGLFLCSMFLWYEQLSKRLVPEGVTFIANTILHLAPHQYKDRSSLPGSFPSPDFRSDITRSLSVNTKKATKITARKLNIMDITSTDSQDDQLKLSLLKLSLDLLGKYAELYTGMDGFVELFEPLAEILENIERARLPDNLSTSIVARLEILSRLLKFARQARQPLLLQAHKPIPIPTYIPKFETTTSSYLRRQDPDHERNEASKLRNQYKQEKKGAIRELRKDARFLAGVEQAKQKEKDRAYSDRMKRVFGTIEGERAEEKAMEREKSREKRRSGRK